MLKLIAFKNKRRRPKRKDPNYFLYDKENFKIKRGSMYQYVSKTNSEQYFKITIYDKEDEACLTES
jgi:hypothetical protein